MQQINFSYLRSLILGLLLAVMLTVLVPSLTGTNIAYADGIDFGGGVTGSVTGVKPDLPGPSGNPDGPITQTAGSGSYSSGICQGLRPLGVQPPNATIICRQSIIHLAMVAPGSDPWMRCQGPNDVGLSFVRAWWWNEATDSLDSASEHGGHFTCISQGYRDVNLVCLNNASVVINMFLPGNSNLSTVTANTSWGDGDHTYGSCYNSARLQASSYVPIVDYGRYSAQFRLYGNVVQFRMFDPDPFTGVTKQPELLNDSGPQLRKQSAKYLQYTCAGAIQSDANAFGGSWTWTENDCAPGNSGGNTPTFQCVNMDSPTVNGVPRSQTNQILRDGDANSINWSTPNVTGASLVGLSNPSTTLTVNGTPTFANSQLSLKRNGAGIFTNSSYTNSIATNYELKARWASDKDNPLVLSQSYNWTGTWNKTSWAVTGVDFDAEEFIITPVTVTTQADVTCTPGNVSFDVLRATNG